jgi:hypothetical protein
VSAAREDRRPRPGSRSAPAPGWAIGRRGRHRPRGSPRRRRDCRPPARGPAGRRRCRVADVEMGQPGQALADQGQLPRGLAVAEVASPWIGRDSRSPPTTNGHLSQWRAKLKPMQLWAARSCGVSGRRGGPDRWARPPRPWAFAQLAGHQLRGAHRADPDGDVGARVHQVDDRVAEHDVEDHLRIARREPRDQRQQVMQAERHVGIDPHPAARRLAGGDRALGLVQVGQHPQGPLVEQLALRRQGQLAGRAVDQPRAQPRLQPR